MKTNVILFLFVTAGIAFLRADPAQDLRDSQVLAVKLFPACADANSPLVKRMTEMFAVLHSNRSSLDGFCTEPLVVAVEAASTLKIEPQWSALSETERDHAFKAVQLALLMSHDFSDGVGQPAIALTPAVAPSPPSQLPQPHPTIAGYHAFFSELAAQSTRVGALLPKAIQNIKAARWTE
jgi:hypothetical protein